MRSAKADFTFADAVGTGTYGTVWRAVRKQDGKTYALKEVDLRYLHKQVTDRPISSICQHPLALLLQSPTW